MKKLVFLSALFALVAALVFTACKKDETTQSPETATWANPANPFDHVGMLHNQCLDVLTKHPGFNPMDAAEGFRILAEEGFGQGDLKTFQRDFSGLYTMKHPIKGIADRRFHEGSISEGMHKALLELDKIVMGTAFTDQLNTDVRAFEATIAGRKLTDDETRMLYQSSSTARYSNQYWSSKGADHATDRKYTNFEKGVIIGADVVGALGGGVSGALTSIGMGGFIDFVNNFIVIGGGGNGGGDGDGKLEELPLPPSAGQAAQLIGWPWGGGIYGPPCNPGYACPCTIELNPLDPAPFYMAGQGFYTGEELLVLDLDGSQLGDELYDQLNTGNFYLDRDFEVPSNTINALRAANGLPPQDMRTIFPEGDHPVSAYTNAHIIHIVVVYDDGTTVNVVIIIRH